MIAKVVETKNKLEDIQTHPKTTVTKSHCDEGQRDTGSQTGKEHQEDLRRVPADAAQSQESHLVTDGQLGPQWCRDSRYHPLAKRK